MVGEVGVGFWGGVDGIEDLVDGRLNRYRFLR